LLTKLTSVDELRNKVARHSTPSSHLLRIGAAILIAAIAPAPSTAALQGPTAVETYHHDAIGRLTDIAYANGGSFHYTYDANGNLLSVVTSLATAVEGGGAPLQFALGPTTPNPGSGARSMAFTIPARGHVTLRVFDVSGREVATLFDRVLDPGRYVARFSSGRWAGGVYFYRLATGGRVRVGRMVVLR
jgi:YD repeat-containing protein